MLFSFSLFNTSNVYLDMVLMDFMSKHLETGLLSCHLRILQDSCYDDGVSRLELTGNPVQGGQRAANGDPERVGCLGLVMSQMEKIQLTFAAAVVGTRAG
jgi:hypothetical protein